MSAGPAGWEPSWTPRLPWVEVPTAVRQWAEDLLGGPTRVVSTGVGGFSRGPAVRLAGPGGSTAFVKAVGSDLNHVTPELFRSERSVVTRLPAGLPVPALLSTFDDGDWVALAFTYLDAAPAQWPWSAEDLRKVLAALDHVGRVDVPGDLVPLSTRLADDANGWAELIAGPDTNWPHLTAWDHDRAGELDARARAVLAEVDGTSLVHLDVRADNVLIDRPGNSRNGAWLVDWAWGSRGAAWVDIVLLLVNVAVGGDDPQYWLQQTGAADADPEAVTGLLALLTGMWAAGSVRPPHPGMSAVRGFQAAHLAAARRWLQQRLG